MPWIGTLKTLPGLLTGFEDTIEKVRDFDEANTLTNLTVRVTDAPTDDLTLRVHDQADGLGLTADAVILSGTTYISQAVSMVTGSGLWQEVVGDSHGAMSLSGEYTMSSATGIATYFTDLTAVKLDANITTVDADRDTVLTSYIAGVTGMMQDWIGRDIVQGTTTEKIDGHGLDSIFTQRFPITNITSVTEDGTALVEDTDFESVNSDLNQGRLVRISGTKPIAWSSGRRNIAITYDHGYVTIPPGLVTAATALVVAKYYETERSGKGWRGLASKGVDPSATTLYDKEIWQRETIPAMMPFRRFQA
jgi:hypothetical protein